MSWKENKQKKRKRLRNEAKLNGWCEDCYLEDKLQIPAKETYRRCEMHLALRRERETQRRRKFSEAGMCWRHRWGTPVVPGLDECARCNQRDKETDKIRRNCAIASNKCIYHTDRDAVPGRRQCEECLIKGRKAGKKRRKKAKDNGKCIRHIYVDAITGDSCIECWYKDVARNNLKGVDQWQDLKKLLENQGFKCAYSGVILIPGDNASVDHKTPRSRGGLNVIENLQWVSKKINSMKGDFTHSEFVELCKIIAQNVG